jgi:phage minor structural protein
LYETQLEIIADEKNKYITGQAVLKVPVRHHDEISYQLFRIYSINSQMDNSGNQSITANARHIFYDLNHRILRSCRPMSKSGQAALEWIFSKVINGLSNDEIIFNYYSDITSPRTAYYENTTVTAALLGEDNSFVNRWGGYLYRDNFYFSINREMEYSRKTGVIRYGSNMTDIDFTIDYSDCVTYLYAIDNFNNTKIIKNSAVPSSEFPHHIYKIVKFSYDEEDKEQFEEDAQAYYDNYKQPEVNIKVKFANLHDVELYADILELEDFDVGDKVIVYHKDLGINYGNLEIISRTYDAVNDKVTSIEIGTFKNAISRSEYMSGTVSAGSLTAAERQLAATQSQVDEIAFSTYVPTPITTVDGKYLTTADGKYLCYRKE